MSQITVTPDLVTNQIDSPKGHGCPLADCPVDCPRHCAQNVTHIPQSFSEEFLWHFTDTSLASCKELEDPVVPSKQIFSDELVAEVLALVSYTFACTDGTVWLGSDGIKEPPERSITLYCPDKGGNVILDSMVKHVAAHHNADVLVLDALELAAGEFGALGESGSVIDLVYSEPKNSEDLEDWDSECWGFDNQRVQAFFDALVNIPCKCSHKYDRQGSEPTAIKPLRRIIYLRDFGTIAPAAKPLMAYILQAIHNARNPCCPEGIARAPVLVMGITKSMVSIEAKDESPDEIFMQQMGRRKDASPHTQQHTALRAGGYKLRQIIPCLSNVYPRSNDEASAVLFNGLSAQLFLPFVVQSSRLTYHALNVDPTWSAKLDDLSACGVFLGIVTKATHYETACRSRELEIQARIQAINDILVRMCLGKRGGLIEEGPSRKIFPERSENDNFRSSIISPSAADTIATIAMGLSYSDSDWSKPMLVTPANVAKGYQIFLGGQRYRESWTDEERKKSQTDETEDPIIKDVKESSSLSYHERGLLGCVVDAASLMTTFDDVCVDPHIKEMLRTVVSLPILHPDRFQSGILAKESIMGVLLYGPPGTGKTMLCRALAHDCGARMIAVKPSDIFAMYVGESDKNAFAVFSLAHRLAPCVVFIDEMDALFGARNGDSNWDKLHRNILTEFMQAMDGLQSAGINKKKGIVVVGATNRPFDVDEAILRRLPCRVLVDLPDKSQRKNILEAYLKNDTYDADLVEIAEGTDGYSGSDLKNLCVSAAMASVKDVIGNFTWNKSGKDTVHHNPTPASDDSEAPPTNHTITMAHFNHALLEVVPSFSEEVSEQLYRWHDMFSTSPNDIPKGATSTNDDNPKITPSRANDEKKNGNAQPDMATIFDMMARGLRK